MAEVTPGADAPVVEQPVVDTTPAPDATAAPDAAPQGEEKPAVAPKYTEEDFQKALQKRLGKESRRLERIARAEAEAAFWREQAQGKQARETPAKPQGRPEPADFADPRDFVEALTEWKLEQKLSERNKQSEAHREQQESRLRASEMLQAISKGKAELGVEDFDDVVFSDDVSITPPMAHAIAESDAPAKIAYYLGTHPEEALRIAQLKSTHQVREIAKLEAKFTAAPAPRPLDAPISPSNTNSPAVKDPARMSDAEWERWRESDLKNKGR